MLILHTRIIAWSGGEVSENLPDNWCSTVHMLKYERLVRRREALILDKVTNLFEHGSLPVRKTEAHLRKPAGQAGSSGNPREIMLSYFGKLR